MGDGGIGIHVWEPACGSGKMVRVLKTWFDGAYGTDIANGIDFLEQTETGMDAIITNPPYELAQEFIEHALHLTQKDEGVVAMLLRTDFDHAKTRQHLFGKCPQFSEKVVLLKRIRWIEGSTGSPSFNHAWFIWDWQNNGRPPTIAYQ
jgi:hypothetical protein